MGTKCCQAGDKIRSTLSKSYHELSTAIMVKQRSTRRKLWEFEHNYHCAIIGTCLSIMEVRNLLKRFQIKVTEFSDYDIHTIAVTMIENNDSRTKKINNHLDRKFKTALQNVKKMDHQGLRQEWKQALKTGEVVATFWAIMTHPLADSKMQKDIYGDIHMLSHLSGASNRADLKRLQVLQSEQIGLHKEISQWKNACHKKHNEIESLKQQINDQGRTLEFYQKKIDSLQAINEQLIKLNSEKKRQQLEQQIEKLHKKIIQQDYKIKLEENKNIDLVSEILEFKVQRHEKLNANQKQHEALSASDVQKQSNCNQCELKDKDLCGRCILYVGGQTNMAPHYKEVVEANSGVFLHHDGGIEKNKQELASLLNRADVVICPTNCISHNAYWQIKKSCKKQNKPCKFIPSSGLSSLANVLENMLDEQAASEMH